MDIDTTNGVAPMPETDKGTPEIMENITEEFTPYETENQAEEVPQNEEEIKSPSGETFNPEIHVSPDSITPKGNFRRKKGAKEKTLISDAEVFVENANTHATAETITFLFVQFGVFAFGEKFRPSSKNETLPMVTSLEKYLEQEGISDIPPGVAVCIAFGGYTIAKMREEECRSNFSKIFSWFKTKITNVIYWFKTRKRAK